MLKERSLQSLSIYICFLFFLNRIIALTVNLPLSLSYPEEDEMSAELQQLQGSTTDSCAGVKDFYEREWDFNIKNVKIIV